MSVRKLLKRHHGDRLVPAVVTVMIVVGTVVLRGPLLSWFSGVSGQHTGVAVRNAEAPSPRLPDDATPHLRAVLDAYEQARALLAADRMDGLATSANDVVKSLEPLRNVMDESVSALAGPLSNASAAATALAAAPDLGEARNAFGELSRGLITLASADKRIVEGLLVFECPMTEGHGRWIQRGTEIENPYMGPSMLACGSPSGWTEASALIHAHEGEIAHYTCPMHPSIRQASPGKCPLCGMDLAPVTTAELHSGVLFVDAGKRQKIGVRTGSVERRAVHVELRAAGSVALDEASLSDVTLKYKGWVRTLVANETGRQVRRGETLLTLYSPELYAAQAEFIAAVESQRAAAQTSAPNRADYLVKAARQRLKLWDLPDWQIDQIALRKEPVEAIPIVSPASGFIIEKDVVEGAVIEAGTRLFRLARLDRVWVEADVQESDLPLVRAGMEARVVLPHADAEPMSGRVKLVLPKLDPQTRTGRVRIELPNEGHRLKPDMYATVELRVERGERLVVPESAIVFAGTRRIVFADLGEGRLLPKEVEVGAKSGDFYEVRSGLEEGESVVTSANFLVAAESRLKSAVEAWR